MIPAVIGVAFDLATAMPVTVHKYMGTTPGVPVSTDIEIPTPQFWPPGAAFQNKLTMKTFARGQNIVQSGHDCGALIQHFSVPPDNVLAPVHTILSSRKTVFDAAKVLQEGTPSAAFPMVPLMTVCAFPTSFPGVSVPTSPPNVMLTMTVWDLVRGLLKVAAAAAFDFLFLGLSGGFSSASRTIASNVSPRELMRIWGRELVDGAFGVGANKRDTIMNLTKAGLSSISGGLIDGATQAHNPTVKAELGHPVLGGLEVSSGRGLRGFDVSKRGVDSPSAWSGAGERLTNPLERGWDLL